MKTLGLLIGVISAVQMCAAVGLTENQDGFRCTNGDAAVVIERQPWRVRLIEGDGAERFAEAVPPALKIDGEWAALASAEAAEATSEGVVRLKVTLSNGVAATADVHSYGSRGFRVVVRAPGHAVTGVRGATVLHAVEEIYGFGEMWNGHVAQRGQAFDLWNKGGTPDECAYMPYYVSTRNYAFFLHYGGNVRFDVGQLRADQLTYEAPASELDLAIVAGESIASTVENFLTVAGLPQRPPRWTFQPWLWLMAEPKQPGAKIDKLKGEHYI
jgi:alpha-D-xyloside xylohydrolase